MLLGALALFASVVQRSYAIEEWLFWHYATYWAACAVWLAGVLGVGHLTVTRAFGLRLPLHEATTLALAIGLFEFELAMLGVGMAHGFQMPAFFLVPLAFL